MKVLLITYDNNSHIHYFPLGLAYVASAMRGEGYDVEVYPQDIYHYPDAHLVKHLLNHQYDIACIGMCGGYYQYKKLKELAEAIGGRARLWLGGHLVTPDTEYFYRLTGADYICTGEYDFKENIDEISYPAWDLFDIDYYSLIRLPHAENKDRCFPVLSGRGCPYRCSFCYRMTEGYRSRSIPGIIEEVSILISEYHINYIDFADELLMTSPDRAIKISEALRPLGIKWMCNGRLNSAKPEVLRVMRDSGCVFINYGIEALDNQVLENMNKKLTVEQIIRGVESTLEVGISPGFNIIWGNIGDTRETLWKGVEFLLKYDDHSQLRTIRPVTPYPGCDLYYYAIEKGLLKDCADFYENKHTNSDLLAVNFTDLPDDEFHGMLLRANKVLLQNYYKHLSESMIETAEKLYLQRDASFRGFR